MLKKLFVAVLAWVASIGFAMAAVNINTATVEQLESLAEIGPTKARAIVDYRKTNGGFKTLEEIKQVKGIGDKTFDKIKPQLSLTGETKIEPQPVKGDKKADKTTAKPAKAETAAAQPAASEKKGKI
ncbi:ComEA family DNA-binding protein [Uliginosibacterium aquaticum]|uniref:Helix-hairpin-helix domain-containing protein n=1 Tax=Uliginosibacterium aquaticum TaxID=2731212 RepID=A0ABX2IEU3_9RHOO|nr:helix-hairpin-helix domain-containing protein [Uliginosibacterium aquaticum]NSL54667.1 helix-hairpin-helix domain-containing protein [Uliginosibacterium aquaticum]